MFQPRQLLSAIAPLLLAAAASTPASVQAQQAPGNDFVQMKPAVAGQPGRSLQNVLVTGVNGSKVSVRDASGEVAYDLAQIQSVTKAAPPELAKAQQAIEAGNLDAALPAVKAIAERFKGLPVSWEQEAMALLGSLYVTQGKLSEAETAFSDVEKFYGGANSTAAKIGKARLAAAKKRFSEARTIATELTSGALTQKNISRADSQVFGQAYYVLGQCAESEGKLPEAMENYCRTVAIFYQEPAIVKEAQLRIDELRQKKVTTP